jgi:uracil-DNA glycosylase
MALYLPSRRTWKDLKFWKERWPEVRKKLEEREFFPTKSDIFRALLMTRLEDVRVVILGQDPYPGPGMANGLAFSLKAGYAGKYPPTLVNIFRELKSDTGEIARKGDLSSWAKEGVLLLNTHLTVCPGEPMSHRDIGWKDLTDEIVSACAEENSNTVFVLWGNEAQESIKFTRRNPLVKSAHPSPLSAHRGFFKSRPFTKVNSLLQMGHQGEIDWSLS